MLSIFEMDELVDITINHHGQDLQVRVDVETANTLLNDPEEAGRYAEQIMNFENAITNSEDDDDGGIIASDEDRSTGLKTVWNTKGKPTKSCNEASQLLLELRLQMQSKFNDKKTSKDTLWGQIVNQMREVGFNVHMKQVKQKYANLQKSYIKFVDNMKKTGTKKQNPPPFYKELHAILGMKDKCNPQLLQDTQDDCDVGEASNSISVSNSASTSSSEAEKIKNRFSNAQTSIRPKTNSQKMFNLLQAQSQEERNERQFIQKILEKQVEQRDRMLDILQSMSKGKKRRRNSSSSDEEL